MSGPNAPLETALAWCGWGVRTYELLSTPFDPPKNLLDRRVQLEAETDIEVCDLLTFQMDCKTLSRARNIPPRGAAAKKIRSLPLRSDDHVRGLPCLKKQDRREDKKKVDEANALMDWGLGQLHKQIDKDDGALMENPQGSYGWDFERAAELLEKGCEDWDHNACAFCAARAKKQRWRGNIRQLRERRAECKHVHSADEWHWERAEGGDIKLQTQEEAEYTAHHAFYVAVQCSIWAVQTGRAVLKLPKYKIVPLETGSRVGWSKYPPQALRSWAMPGFGLRLHLTPPMQHTGLAYEGLPAIEAVHDSPKELPQTSLYVGAGDALRKLSQSTWHQAYQGMEAEEPVTRIFEFSTWFHWNSKACDILRKDALKQPRYDKLVVDEQPGTPTHAEVVSRWMWTIRREHDAAAPAAAPDRKQPQVVPPRRTVPPTNPVPVPTKRVAKGVAALGCLPTVRSACEAHVHQAWRWSDVEIHRAIRKFFPEHLLRDCPLPPLEDLVNDERLAAWRIWADVEGVSKTPIQAQARATGWESLAIQKQRAATGSKRAVDPVVGFGMGKQDHFRAACHVGDEKLDPYAMNAKSTPDMRFAAEQTMGAASQLRDTRQAFTGVVKELQSRTNPLSRRLWAWQPPHVAQVAGKLNLGFIVVVCLLILWADGQMPYRFVQGFQGGGKLEESCLWELVDEPEPLPEAEVFEAFRRNKQELLSRPMDKEAQFLYDSCEKEVKKGVALKAVPESALRAKYGARACSAIPCFTHTQACGKKRRIDNAKKSLDNAATQYTEKFRLPNAYAPGLSARLLFQAGRKLGLQEEHVWELLELESGGEDLPDAFRSIPLLQEYLRRNIVMLRHPNTKQLLYYQMLAALFGQGSSVYSFERWSAFLEAAPRRSLWLLWVMYVDDGSLVDLQAAKGSGQALVHAFFDAVGTGLSPEKRAWMARKNTFLGVEHTLAEVPTHQHVKFWPKETIEQELRAQIKKFRATKACPPGDASKFRGVAGFAAEAQFGQLGKQPLRPFKQRQYWDRPPWTFTKTMERAAQFMEMLLDKKLERSVKVRPDGRPALVVASDAQVEAGELPGGGVLVYDPETQRRYGGYLRFLDAALGLWGTSMACIEDGSQPIQLCEAAMVPLTLLEWPGRFRGRRMVWYIDNTSAMASFVKGASKSEQLERIVGLFWMLAWHLDIQV